MEGLQRAETPLGSSENSKLFCNALGLPSACSEPRASGMDGVSGKSNQRAIISNPALEVMRSRSQALDAAAWLSRQVCLLYGNSCQCAERVCHALVLYGTA
jgi:hypothetical protein